jgi:hypothetical protein
MSRKIIAKFLPFVILTTSVAAFFSACGGLSSNAGERAAASHYFPQRSSARSSQRTSPRAAASRSQGVSRTSCGRTTIQATTPTSSRLIRLVTISSHGTCRTRRTTTGRTSRPSKTVAESALSISVTPAQQGKAARACCLSSKGTDRRARRRGLEPEASACDRECRDRQIQISRSRRGRRDVDGPSKDGGYLRCDKADNGTGRSLLH